MSGHPSADSADAASERRFILRNITWDKFEKWLEIRGESSGARLSYRTGELELMSPSPEHEQDKRDIERLLETYSDETGIELNGMGSLTLTDRRAERGAEPDTSFVVGKRRSGPPDLVIEVLWTRPLLDKLDIYSALGVKEVWLWRRERGFEIHRRTQRGFVKAAKSGLLPDIDLKLLARYVGGDNPSQASRAYRAALRTSFRRRRN